MYFNYYNLNLLKSILRQLQYCNIKLFIQILKLDLFKLFIKNLVIYMQFL
mgnify:CR=1 FL=1